MTVTLPHTFEGGGYQVRINADRSILVRQGDWLSKYSMAIYGNFANIRKFKQRIGTDPAGNNLYRDVPNPDLIRTGETLYHPDPLPDEAPGTGTPGTQPQIPRSRIWEFMNWVWNRYLTCDWEFAGAAGLNVSGFLMSGQYLIFDVKHTAAQVTGRFYGNAVGLTLNIPKSVFGISGDPGPFPDLGFIRRTPWRKQLILEDFCHGIIVIEFSVAAYGASTSPTMMFFGIGFPPWRILNALQRYFYTGDPAIFGMLVLDGGPKGVAFFAGLEPSTPGVGLALRGGVMYDRLPWHAR